MNDVQLADQPAAHRFEIKVGDQLAGYSEYNVLANGLLFTHTEILPAFEGHGYGSQLARFALDEARQRGVGVIPVCQFIAGFLRKHVEYQDLVTPENRRAFKI
jgi:predicted GNAT family acetyltransferase